MKKLSLLLGVFLLFSVPAFAKKDAAWVVKKAKATEDKFNGTTSVAFPNIKYYTLGNDEIVKMTGKSKWGYIPPITYSIKETTQKDGSKTYLLLAADDRSSWAFYESAKDNDGKEMKFIRPMGDVDSYSTGVKVTEYFNIVLPEEYIKQHKETGAAFRVYGKKDQVTFHVPGWYFEGVLNYFENQEK